MIEKLWIDLETTGLDSENDTIIEIACIYKDITFHKYCLPEKRPDDFSEIEELTGITWDFLKIHGIPEKSLFQLLVMFLDGIVDKFNKKDKLIFSGYKTDFDNQFIRKLFLKYNNNFFGSYFFNVCLDVMSNTAEELCQGRLHPLENYKLKTVCAEYGIDFQSHSALHDIQATKELYNKITTWEARIG